MNDFFQVIVYYKKNSHDLMEKINRMSVVEFECDGLEEYSMTEEDVDSFLGERAYCGGDLPLDVLDEVDEMNTAQEKSIHYFFYQGSAEEKAQKFIKFIQENWPGLNPQIKREAWKDWNETWKQYYAPILVDDRLHIYPEWYREEVKADDSNKNQDHILYIRPGMGFGTGGHETTFLCLKHMLEFISDPSIKNILDFGCGSGILGLAALKFGDYKVDFCDIDRNALDNCFENLKINYDGREFEGSSLVIRDRLLPTDENKKPRYDFIFANILERTLIEEKKFLCQALKPGGYIIISGILHEQAANLQTTYEKEGFQLIKKSRQKDWVALTMQSVH